MTPRFQFIEGTVTFSGCIRH